MSSLSKEGDLTMFEPAVRNTYERPGSLRLARWWVQRQVRDGDERECVDATDGTETLAKERWVCTRRERCVTTVGAVYARGECSKRGPVVFGTTDAVWGYTNHRLQSFMEPSGNRRS